MVQTFEVTVLNPTAGPATGKFRAAPRLVTLHGKILGAIWNSRPHGDKVIEAAVDVLKERYGIKDLLLRKKPYLGNLAPKEIIDELTAKCDAVITGVGD
jgi:hypothetical protein